MAKNFGSSGFLRWLSLCLLVVLAILLLIVNLVSFPQQSSASPKSTPTPHPTVVPSPTSTPTPMPTSLILNLVPYKFCLTVDDVGLLADPQDSAAVKAVKDQLLNDIFLKKPGRRAGLVIPYGGAPDQNHAQMGLAVADKVVGILKTLGTQKFVFSGSIYHDSIDAFNQSSSFVELEIYLYAQSDFMKPPPGNCSS